MREIEREKRESEKGIMREIFERRFSFKFWGKILGFIPSDLREMGRENKNEKRALFFLSPNI